MPKYSAFITEGEHGKIIHKFIIIIDPKPDSEFYSTEVVCLDPWPPSDILTAIIGVKSEEQGLEHAMKSIRERNQLINKNRGHDIEDIYHGPFLIDESNDQAE